MSLLHPFRETKRGFEAFLWGVQWLRHHKKYMLLLAIPVCVGLAVLVSAWNWLFPYRETILTWILFPKPDNFALLTVYYLAWALVSLGLIVISLLGCILASNIVAAPIYEIVSMAVEKDLTQTAVPEPGLFTTIKLIGEELKKTGFILLTSLLLLMIPGVNVLAFFITALLVGWDYVDFPLARRGWSFQSRLRFVGRHGFSIMGFGVWLLIPFVQVLILPIAIVGGTKLCVDSLRHGSRELPKGELDYA